MSDCSAVTLDCRVVTLDFKVDTSDFKVLVASPTMPVKSLAYVAPSPTYNSCVSIAYNG